MIEGAQAADEELPVHAEVEQAGAERHREAQAGEDERRGADQGLGDGSKGRRDVLGVPLWIAATMRAGLPIAPENIAP